MSLFHETVQRFALFAAVDLEVPVQLASTEEYIDGQFTGNLGEVLIRYQQARNTTLSTACCLGSCFLSTSSCYPSLFSYTYVPLLGAGAITCCT